MTKTKPSDWIFFADSDLKLTQEAIEEEIYHLACFHAQQAAEKLLKAYLVFKDKPIPKLHSLRELYTKVQPLLPELLRFKERLLILDQYYIPTRYPDALPGTLPEGLPTAEHAHAAVASTLELSAFIREHLK